MCTVSLFPEGKNGFILTSNRDEAPNRRALEPDVYEEENVSMWYPKDPEGKGSWIGVSSKNRVVCLLNGAFKKHQRQLPYRQSRGLVVTHLLKCEHLESELKEYNLHNIEPFTLITVDWNANMKWFELIWDGQKQSVRQLSFEPQVWSSSTLYNENMREERKQWFESFLKEKDYSSQAILGYHHTAGVPNKDYGVVMDRGFVKTTSITQLVKTSEEIQLSFEDLQAQKHYQHTLELPLVVNE